MKFVNIAIPYDDLTIALECMECVLHDTKMKTEREKVQRSRLRLQKVWGENARIEEDE